MNQIERGNCRIYLVPKSQGFHGSKSLWEGQVGAEEYWTAQSNFLATLK